MMPTDGKVLIIQCVNSKKETISFRMKNMPDVDEMKNIIQIGKKIQCMHCILFGFEVVLVFTFIISCMWFLRSPAKTDWASVYMIILFLVYVICCISEKTIRMALEKRIVVQKCCGYVWKYMETYSKDRWDELLIHVKGYRALTDGDVLKDANDVNMVISFCGTFFALYLPERICEMFWPEDIIRDSMLNMNTVEFDFVRSELRVPMHFEEV